MAEADMNDNKDAISHEEQTQRHCALCIVPFKLNVANRTR